MNNYINQTQNEIIDEFSKFNDFFEIYEYLIQLGKNLEKVNEIIQTDDYIVGGCQSQVWLKADIKKEKIHYFAYSDSLLINGIISLILKVLNDNKPEDIINADLFFIEKIGLKSNLSPTRGNGLISIIKQMKSYAEKATNNF